MQLVLPVSSLALRKHAWWGQMTKGEVCRKDLFAGDLAVLETFFKKLLEMS